MSATVKLPDNPVRGVLQVALPGFIAVYLGARARLYGHSDALVVAACIGGGSGLSVACYYWRIRFLWYDFGARDRKSVPKRVLEAAVNVLIVTMAVVALAVIIGQQN